MKKLLLGIGMSVAIIAPMISVIACGTDKLKDKNNSVERKNPSTKSANSSVSWLTMTDQ